MTCSSAFGVSFVDNETPKGTIDGVNAVYLLAAAPNPQSSLHLALNGILLTPKQDFTLTFGTKITFMASKIPQPGSVILASYRLWETAKSGFLFNNGTSITWSQLPYLLTMDEETPAGTLDGVNTTFTLSQTPNPPTSLLLFINGLRQHSGVDFTLAGNTITLTGFVPTVGQNIVASYRFVSTGAPPVQPPIIQADILPGKTSIDSSLQLSRTDSYTNVPTAQANINHPSVTNYSAPGSVCWFDVSVNPNGVATPALFCTY